MPRKRPPIIAPAGRHASDKRSIEWNRDKILELIEKSVGENRQNLFLLMLGGIACLIMGICFLIFSKSGKGLATGIICMLSGCLAPFPYLLDLANKDLRKSAGIAKKFILENPGELVWAHIFERRIDSDVSKFWLLKFRNGTCIEIPYNLLYAKRPEYLWEENIRNFTSALRKINPGIYIGYTAELEVMYKNRLM
jgi:hypothetical protein